MAGSQAPDDQGIEVYGNMEVQEDNDSFIRLKTLAGREDVGAEFLLGTKYEERGLYTEALRCYKQAAKRGHEEATCSYVLLAQKLVLGGNTRIQRELGTFAYLLAKVYEKGNGVDRDSDEALEFLYIAAEAGHKRAREALKIRARSGDTDAQIMIAGLCREELQIEGAFNWSLAAGDLCGVVRLGNDLVREGSARSQYRLAQCLENSRDCLSSMGNKGLDLVWTLYSLAANRGNRPAKERIESLLSPGKKLEKPAIEEQSSDELVPLSPGKELKEPEINPYTASRVL